MCPVCQQPLRRQDRRFECDLGHNFDIAREGYVNLLLAHQRRSTQPGDGQDAVRGRRAFLAAGHFDRLSDQINEVASSELLSRSQTELHVLDSGCGEGLYLRRLGQRLSCQPDHACTCWGVDISRPAVSLAARADRQARYAVASAFRLPVLPATVDVAYSVFAPSDAAELRRVLRPDGRLLVVAPGPRHLQSLRHLVYESPREHPVELAAPPGFRRLSQTRLTHTLELSDPEDVRALIAMTPYRWHVSAPMGERLAALDRLDTEADFLIAVCCPQQDAPGPSDVPCEGL